MTEPDNKSVPLSSAAILANRPFQALSAAEKASYGAARQREAQAVGQAIADNLNRKA